MSAPVETEHVAKGGEILTFLIGAAGMAARILLSEEKHTWPKAACLISGAGIVGWLVGMALESTGMAYGLRMAAVGMAGSAATQIIDFILRWLQARGNAELAKVKKK